jgi:pyridoxamine 5'-phosphate oxidase-like protein
VSRKLGSVLPADLLDRLSGKSLEPVASKVIQIFTVDASGWAHPALLSYFEVVAKDAARIRLATYANSTTSGNMRRNGKVTLVVVDERVAYYVKGQAVELAPALQTTDWNAAFECRVAEVTADEVNEEYEPGAYVASGITYYNPQRAAELERARGVLAELNAL